MSSEAYHSLLSLLRANKRQRPNAIAELRAVMERSLGLLPPDPRSLREPAQVSGLDAAWFHPPAPNGDNVILYLHGGAYFMGSVNTHASLTSRLACAAGMRVLAIDYRLAPEHRFPAQLEDAVSAYRWLLEQGHQPDSIAFAGDSAGGGLALSTLCEVRDLGLPLPACGAAISPWTDLEGLGDSMRTHGERDPMLSPQDIGPFSRIFLGHANPRDPRAAPLHADLAGLPPLLIQVGTEEILLDDAIRFAAKAESHGVRVLLEVADDMFHVWHLFASLLPEGQSAIERMAAFVNAHVQP